MPRSPVKPQVIVIGTNHPLQAGDDSYTPAQLKAFANLIETTRKKYRVKFIAEEMSVDALPDYGVTATIAKALADRKKLVHRYINLTSQELAALGVDRFSLHKAGQAAGLWPAQFAALEKTVEELRECVWLVRVLSTNKWPALLICGANHVPRVQYLFNTVGKPAVIEVNDYEAQPCNAPDFARKAAQDRRF